MMDGESLSRTDDATPYQVERGDAAKLLVPVKLPNWDEVEYGEYCSVCNQESRSLGPRLNPEKKEVKGRKKVKMKIAEQIRETKKLRAGRICSGGSKG